MMRSRIAAVATAAGLGMLAHGQATGANGPAATQSPPGLSASMSATSAPSPVFHQHRRLKPGMVVLDRRGVKIGVITRTNQIKDGRPAVLIDVTGTQIKVRRSKLRLTADGEEAVIFLTRSQVRTSAILNTF